MAFSTHDIVPDSPTNNFATWNPLDKGSEVILSNGNLVPTWSGVTGHSVRSSISYPKTGKWYLEVVSGDNSSMGVIDISKPIVPASGALWPGADGFGSAGSYALAPDGTKVSNSVYASFLSDYSSGSIIKILYDADLGDLKFGIDSGNLTTAYNINTNTTWAFAIGFWTSGGGSNICNFGQDPTFAGAKSPSTTYTDANGIGAFYYQPPTDALALCTANLPEMTPDVAGDIPQDYFKAATWTGQTADSTFSNNGNNNWSKTGVGFSPDFVWIKKRTGSGASNNSLFDTIRGATNGLHSDNGDQQFSDSTTLTSFDSNGFSVGTHAVVNDSSGTYVSWCWKAGGSPSATDDGTGISGSAKLVDTSGAASSTTCKSFKDAAVTAGASNVICPSKMSINQAAGFSIIKYNTGQTGHLTGGPYSIPHGLGAEPKFIIIKSIDNAFDWLVYHRSVANVNYNQLNGSNAPSLSDSNTYSGSNTEYVVNIGGTVVIAADGDYIMYSWSPVEGYSKFGSYVGNGSADGPFGYTDFRPAFVMIKRTDTSGYFWVIFDEKRVGYNPSNWTLAPNSSNAESQGGNGVIDLLSNGFKCRNTDGGTNASGGTYIFMAFAEQPFKFSNAR